MVTSRRFETVHNAGPESSVAHLGDMSDYPSWLWVMCGERDRVHLVALTKALNLREPKRTKAGQNDPFVQQVDAL